MKGTENQDRIATSRLALRQFNHNSVVPRLYLPLLGGPIAGIFHFTLLYGVSNVARGHDHKVLPNGRQPEFIIAVFIQVSAHGRTLGTRPLPLGAEEDAAGYRFSLTGDAPCHLGRGAAATDQSKQSSEDRRGAYADCHHYLLVADAVRENRRTYERLMKA